MIEQVLKVLVEAGYTPVSAARAAVVLDRGGSTAEARAVLEYGPPPALFEVELLVAEAVRELEAVRV